MSDAGAKYKALLRELVRARVNARGELPMHVESRYVEKLDELWKAMDGAERGAIERELADKEFGC